MTPAHKDDNGASYQPDCERRAFNGCVTLICLTAACWIAIAGAVVAAFHWGDA